VITIVGKYIDQGDAYLLVIKALIHAVMSTKQRLRVEWIDTSSLIASEEDKQDSYIKSWECLKGCHGCVSSQEDLVLKGWKDLNHQILP
jgi:CTP synthase (UTP-ammonia lyase)